VELTATLQTNYMTNTSDKVNVYEIITLRILDMLEEGKIPWNKPYLEGASGQMPMNLISGKCYRGINRWLLRGQFDSPYYLTLKQVLGLKARVRREEFSKPSIVTYWNMIETIDKVTKEKKQMGMLRYYRVYNVTQCEGLKHSRLVVSATNDNQELLEPASIVKGMPNKPTIKFDSSSVAYYQPSDDSVHIGTVKQFKTSEMHYATMFHELIHSTGHKSRLERDLKPSFAKEEYSREELIAEFGSAFLCEITGISKPTIKNATAYIQHWKEFISSDVQAVVSCASKAEKSCDFILNRKVSNTNGNGEIE
jgi:antirestriction protein ArdC